MNYVLIPAYNESPNLENLLNSLKKYLNKNSKILIVDDGSSDNSQKTLSSLSKKYPLIPLGYKKNHGAGYAFKYGFNYLIPKLKKGDLVITMEADNTTDYKILSRMISLTNDDTVILGSPHAKGGGFIGVRQERILLSKIAAILDSVIFGIKNIKTYSSFYRVYPAKQLKKLKATYGNNFITQNGFPAGIEMLIKLQKIGAHFEEVPAVVDWKKRKGKSKMNIQKATKNHFSLYWQFLSGKYN